VAGLLPREAKIADVGVGSRYVGKVSAVLCHQTAP